MIIDEDDSFKDIFQGKVRVRDNYDPIVFGKLLK